MDASAQRLYEAAKTLKNTEGQSAVARLLHQSPQTLNNWERRGVSRPAAIRAQELIGCSATWLMTGQGEMRADGRPSGAVFEELSSEEEEMLAAFRILPDKVRAELVQDMKQRAADAQEYIDRAIQIMRRSPRAVPFDNLDSLRQAIRDEVKPQTRPRLHRKS